MATVTWNWQHPVDGDDKKVEVSGTISSGTITFDNVKMIGKTAGGQIVASDGETFALSSTPTVKTLTFPAAVAEVVGQEYEAPP